MTSQSRLFSLGNIERFLFRPVFVFVAFVLLLVAVFEAGGRLSMRALGSFEDELNSVLSGQKIELSGLQGNWRGLNPVVNVAVLRFPGGVITDLELELDVLESAMRSAPVLRLLSVANAQVNVEQTSAGWRLKGMPERSIDFDVMSLLKHSDNMTGRVQLLLTNLAAETSTLNADIEVVNRGGVHYADISIANPAYADVQLDMQVWQAEPVLFVAEAINSGHVAGTLMLPQALTGMPGLAINLVDTYWYDQAEQGGGALNLTLDGVQLPASAATLIARLSIDVQRRGALLQAKSSPLQLEVAGDQMVVGPFYIDVQASKPMLAIWSERLDLGRLTSFFNQHLGGWEPAASWVRALAVGGEANNLHGYYDPELGVGFMASISDLHMQGYKGAPTLTNVGGRMWGYGPGIAMQVNGRDVTIGFPDLYHEDWTLDSMQGLVKAWFGGGYFGMQGSHLKARMGDTSVVAGYAITRPQERTEQRLSLQIGIDQVSLLTAKTFVPYKIPQGFASWLARGPRAGELVDAQFAMHGQTKLLPGELGRRIEVRSKIRGGRVEYDPRWPEVTELVGELHVAGIDTRINVSSARTLGVKLEGVNIVLRNNSRYATGTIDTKIDAVAMFDFVRNSPLADSLSFITPQWSGTGKINLHGNLVIPINAELSPPLRVDLQFYLDGVGLDMPEYRIHLDELRGSGTFSLPHNLSGAFSGQLFDHPVSMQAHSDDQWLQFDIKGTATPDDVYDILATQNSVPISGQFEFESVLSLATGSAGGTAGVTNLSLKTDLIGLQMDFPGQFAKHADTAIASELDVQFLSNYQSVRWQYADVNGWLHYGDRIERGAVGIGVPPPMTAQDEKAVVISGRMPSLVLSDWVSDRGDASVSLPLDWVIQGLTIDHFIIDELSFDDLQLSGAQRGENVRFGFDGPTLKGTVELPADGVMAINLEYLQLEDTDADVPVHIGAPQIDPISVAVGESLPQATVSIKQLVLGEEPFGSWRFFMQPAEQQVLFSDFAADVNGVHIFDSALAWDLTMNTSSFQGKIKLDDLAETLPLWDYAASLTTKRANVNASIVWPGSPLNVSLLQTSGEIGFNARDGRFIEVEAGGGGLRILSLLNFTKVAKRINFDISDVVGEGISFDKINATIKLNKGQLTFPKPMVVESSSGTYQIGGQVDLASGQLDNEMIVTLPVSKSLPWYGIYLALANPLVGLGVVVGERVLRKPIEQFSTAKFSITGTLDDPQVKFVSLWNRKLKQAVTTQDTTVETEEGKKIDG